MSAADAIIASVEAVTKEWARQRKAEERDRRAEFARHDRLMRTAFRPMTILEAAYQFMAEAYAKASGDGKLPAKARQVMYAARPKILDATERDTLSDAYFTQQLLPDFIEEHPEICAEWDIIWDARGHLVEPHTGEVVPLGTLEVRRYLALHDTQPARSQLPPSQVGGRSPIRHGRAAQPLPQHPLHREGGVRPDSCRSADSGAVRRHLDVDQGHERHRRPDAHRPAGG